MKFLHLEIETANLKKQFEFYTKKFKFPILEQSPNSFKIKVGYSVLEFVENANTQPYHFAFHMGVSENEGEKLALLWLKKRVDIIPDDYREIIDFQAWKAKSIYFYDSDNNVVEFISRHHLQTLESPFSEKSILGIAEIGLATTHVSKRFQFLNQELGFDLYFGKPEVFCALGTDNGLLILVDTHKKKWFPTENQALPANFALKFSHHGQDHQVSYKNEKLTNTLEI